MEIKVKEHEPKHSPDLINNSIKILVATDIAARGLDIPLLPHVVNFRTS